MSARGPVKVGGPVQRARKSAAAQGTSNVVSVSEVSSATTTATLHDRTVTQTHYFGPSACVHHQITAYLARC